MGIPRLLTLFPHLRGFRVDAVCVSADGITLDVHATRRCAPCPLCGRRSKRRQSTYLRTICDLLCGGLPLILRVRVRRFVCPSSMCARRIFAERYPDLAAPRARQTDRHRSVECQLELLADCLTGESYPAAAVA